MDGLMMQYPLTLTPLLERAGRLFGAKEIASKQEDGTMHRYRYADFHSRVHRLAHVLEGLGVQRGDRIGTLCWNSYRHLELYWAVPCYGAVLHTLNLRLAADQLGFIIHHAGEKVIFVDSSLLPLLEPVRDQIPAVTRIIVLDGAGEDGYEALLERAPSARFEWPQLAETEAAATCYTSGTTGNPKGVLYDHRSIYLHTMALSGVDSFAIGERDTLLQIVPMFHANGWGMPYAAVASGARIVFGGRQIQPRDVAELIQNERVTFTAGVPTIWMTLYAFLESEERRLETLETGSQVKELPHREGSGFDLSSLRMVVAAGSAMPRQFILDYARKYGVQFALAWGMTETTPIATFMQLRSDCDGLAESEAFDIRARHGLPLAGVDLRIIDENGAEVPADGVTMGELQVRGPWITAGYYQDPVNRVDGAHAPSFMDGWFRTGDVATIDGRGYIQIMDRTKDLVKSGGEWISSVDLENAIMGHPKVMEAAVIAVTHPKWQERPLALIAPLPQFRDAVTKEEILEYLTGKVARWWLPDDVVFIDQVPKTSVGKFNKRALREKFKNYVLPAGAYGSTI
jgi:fatty-acyl-CoA synthase